MKTWIAALAALAVLLPAAGAQADVVYQKGSDIWAMKDDGTQGRVLVKASDLPDMDGGIGDPHVDPTGTTVAFTGNTQRNKVVDYGTCGLYPYTYPCWTWHYGFNATGIYLLKNGAVSRQSAAPAYCYNCTMSDYTPDLAAGAGRYAYSFLHCQGTRGAGSYTCNSSLNIKGEGEGGFGTVCGEGEAALFDPAINPANRNQIAYADCTVGSGSESLDAVYVAEAGRANEHPVACDDSSIEDPSFSPSGAQLVTSEGGEQPGLWVYNPSQNYCLAGTTPTNALVNPDTGNISFADPRFMGPGKIVFTAGTKSGDTWQYDLYTIPANCNACLFPSGATRLTEGGVSSAASWTSASLATPPPPPDGDGDGVPNASDACPTVPASTANGCPADGGGGGGDGGGGGSGTAPTISSPSASTVAKLKALLANGFAVSAGCTAGCKVKAALTIDGKVARKLGLTRSRAKNVQVGAKQMSFATAGRKTMKLALSRKAKRAFKRFGRRLPRVVRFRIQLVATGSDGTKSRPVSITRKVSR